MAWGDGDDGRALPAWASSARTPWSRWWERGTETHEAGAGSAGGKGRAALHLPAASLRARRRRHAFGGARFLLLRLFCPFNSRHREVSRVRRGRMCRGLSTKTPGLPPTRPSGTGSPENKRGGPPHRADGHRPGPRVCPGPSRHRAEALTQVPQRFRPAPGGGHAWRRDKSWFGGGKCQRSCSSRARGPCVDGGDTRAPALEAPRGGPRPGASKERARREESASAGRAGTSCCVGRHVISQDLVTCGEGP